MRMGRLSVLLAVAAILGAMLALAGTALALPSERPDRTPMVDGRVRAIEQVGTNVWVGGTFTQVKRRNGAVLANVSNVAVFNSATDRYVDIAPKLGGTDAVVWDIARYGNNVLIAGTFAAPTSTKKNLVLVNGTTGRVIRWYDSPVLRSVLVAPELGRVYGGGVSLSAFNLKTGKKLWTRAETTVDKSLRTHNTGPGYHDLELDGSTIWAACACDAVNGNPAKALVKLSTKGVHDASWRAEAGAAAFGHSLVERRRALYLGAGGSDFLARYPKGGGGNRSWVRDTSGSTQGVAVMDRKLVIGGHFWEVADGKGDKCGSGQDYSSGKLDPNNECKTRKGIAAYSFSGDLMPWNPEYSGSYLLVWALHVEGTRLHTGGQFKRVNGITQNSYARLS